MRTGHGHDHGHADGPAVLSPDHGHMHAEVRRPATSKIRRLRWALIITGTVMVLEVVGGLLTNSLALLSDAGHMFTHMFALAMSYFAIVISARPADRERTFGYFRAEVLTAFINGLFLFAITGYIFYEAITRIVHPEPILPLQMLAVAVIGLVANGASVLLLMRISAGDLNLRSAFVHVVYDAVSSVAVVAAALVIHFTKLWLFDPVVSMMIGVLILLWAWQIVRESVAILLESTPRDIDLEEVRRDMCGVEGVQRVHDIHVWQITTNMYVMTAHVVVGDMPMAQTEEVVERINHYLREHHKIGHTTLQMECDVSHQEEQVTSPREWPDLEGGVSAP